MVDRKIAIYSCDDMAKRWSEEEIQYLRDNWGYKSIGTMGRSLKRSKNAIVIKASKLKLGAFLESGEYVLWNQLLSTLGVTGGGYKTISWVQNRAFPIKTKKVDKKSYKIVYLEDFWKWAEKNKDLLDFSKFQEYSLGKEPAWAKEKRKRDFEKNTKYIKTPWTTTEDSKLKYLLEQHKYTYMDLSKMLRRTNGAIQKRICDLGIKARPLKADNQIKWTAAEFALLEELIKTGYGYELISEKIGRSAKAIRGRVYCLYSTENLDKVREAMIKQGREVMLA